MKVEEDQPTVAGDACSDRRCHQAVQRADRGDLLELHHAGRKVEAEWGAGDAIENV
jgi:hypothetical protein